MRPHLKYAQVLFLLPILLIPSAFTPRVSAAQPAPIIEKTWGGSHNDYGHGIANDSSGDMYVTGYTQSFGPLTPSYGHAVLLKYNSTGGLTWQRLWGGNSDDIATSDAVDASGNIYVTGYTDSFGLSVHDLFLVKYNSTGGLLWQKIWGGTYSSYGYHVAVDPSGNVYVTGETDSYGAGGSDLLLLKFNSSGTLQWAKTWGGSNTDEGFGLAIDSSSNIYVTGFTRTYGPGLDGLALLKFNSAGSLQWQRLWGGAGAQIGYAVALDTSGNVYVTGETSSFGAGGTTDVAVLKYSPAGSLQWQRTWGGAGTDLGEAVAVDSSGTIYVAGSTDSFGAGATDAILLQLNSAGTLLSQQTIGGSGPDFGQGVAVDSSGNPYLAGVLNETGPYVVSSGNSTFGVPTFTPLTSGNSTLGNPPFTPSSVTSNVVLLNGSQTYAGGRDIFLFKYEIPQTVPSCSSCSVVSNSTIASRSYNVTTNTIQLVVSGPHGQGGWVNVTVPKSEVKNGDKNNIQVTVQNHPPTTLTISQNATAFGIYFSFIFSSPDTANISLGIAAVDIPPSLVLLTAFLVTMVIVARQHKGRTLGQASR